MKKILISGINSYIGIAFKQWLQRWPDEYYVENISMRDDIWRTKKFSKFDVVLCLTGVAHVRETKKNESMYYKINRDLPYEFAKKCKSENVKQFIFLSSMSVYGLERGMISKNSPLKPKSNYGKSKLQAEKLIGGLNDKFFKVATIRPPMVYGENCKGNYSRLAKVAIKTPFFPNINNERSMIYIKNLCEFLRTLIDEGSSGLFFPQNNEYVCTSQLVQLIAKAHGKEMKLTKTINLLIEMLKIDIVNKVFGSLVYEKSMSKYVKDYCIYSFEESVFLTEKGLMNEFR